MSNSVIDIHGLTDTHTCSTKQPEVGSAPLVAGQLTSIESQGERQLGRERDLVGRQPVEELYGTTDP